MKPVACRHCGHRVDSVGETDDPDCPNCGAYFVSKRRIVAYGLTLAVLSSLMLMPSLG